MWRRRKQMDSDVETNDIKSMYSIATILFSNNRKKFSGISFKYSFK
jgi:hypothetical protein